MTRRARVAALAAACAVLIGTGVAITNEHEETPSGPVTWYCLPGHEPGQPLPPNWWEQVTPQQDPCP